MTTYFIAVGQNPASTFSAAGPGDIVTFASGVHDDYAVVVSCSGNSTTPVEVRGEPGAVIRHPDGVTGTGYALHVTGDYLYIHDLICENAAKVVVLEGAAHVKLQRIEGRNSGDEAFKIRDASSYVYVEDCEAHDTGLDSTFGEGFYVGSASSNWPDTSSPDLTHHVRLDDCYSYRCSTDGFDAKEGASDIVVKNHVVDHTLGNAPTAGAANGDSGYYSRADRIQFVNCTVTTSSGISQYGFKCYDVLVGATTYGREQYVKSGSSTGHQLGGVGSQSDAPNGMHVYSDFTASAPRIDEVGGAWDPDYSNLSPGTFTEYSWSSPASAYGASSGGGGASAPTFVAHYQSANTSTTSPKTASVTAAVGDTLVCLAGTGRNTGTLAAPTGQSLSWTARVALTGINNHCALYIWTCTVGSAFTAQNLTVTRSGTSESFAFDILRFAGVTAIGATGSAQTTGAPSASITTQQANSVICVVNADFDADDGATRTWRTGAGTLTETFYTRQSGQLTLYCGYHADAGAAGAKTVGLTVPGSQTYDIGAVELKGTAPDTGGWWGFFG